MRVSVPSPATLGLSRPTAAADLDALGWNTPEASAQLWTLAAVGDSDAALNTLMRIHATAPELVAAMDQDEDLRVRTLALLGGSSALGDHLAANPQLWKELAKPLPQPEELYRELLTAVGAEPAEYAQDPERADTASVSLEGPGTYVAVPEERPGQHQAALKKTYRTLMMRLAAYDLAGTFVSRKGQTAPQPHLGFRSVTRLTTALADAALTAALAAAARATFGGRPLDGQLAVIAMGKCGAQELNYISDVDVVFVGSHAQASLTRLAAEFNRMGSACFFEVDANLRPEGKSGALVRTLDSHVSYYSRWAETWEFQAQLKARPLTGYMPLGQDYVNAINPLVWEASQRESFVDDVQAMRRRVLDNVAPELKHRELKLGVGGLRDVEFAVQLLQMVHGRSDESLRVLNTVEALEALIGAGYVGREDGQQLIEAYEFLRLLEHRLQLERFRRTHVLPAQDDERAWKWLARTAGFFSDGKYSAAQMLERRLKTQRVMVQDLHSRLFYRPLLHSVVNLDSDTLKLSADAAKLQLAALGYRFPDRAYEHLTSLASGSTRKARIQSILLPTLMGWLASTADPDAGLLNYRRLSEAAFSATWFLRMLRDEGVVGQRLMRILGTSPYTAELIISAPEVVKLLSDGATGPKLLETTAEQVSSALIRSTQRHADPDKAVAVARSLRRVELARIAAADLLGLMPVEEVCFQLSTVWNTVLEAALRAEVRGWQTRRRDAELADAAVRAGAEPASGAGPINGSAAEFPQPLARIAVIGMGRLGGMELGFGSDADVMVVAEPALGIETSEAIKWAIEITDGMRRRLSKPSGDPPLEVDLGLRPEGRSGPVVRTVASYEHYYRQWGESWEKQALLRADFVAGDVEVGQEFLDMIEEFRYPAGGASQATLRDIRRMKARVDNERLPRGADRNTHTKLGRGALSDIEWTVQLLTMMHAHTCEDLHESSTLRTLEALEQHQLLSATDVEALRQAWCFATDARNALVLVRGKRVDQLPTPGPQLAQVAGAAGWAPEDNQEFLEAYLKVTRHARRVVDEVFWGEAESFEHP
ncbi:bifunctional [glutamine synthetase] adenylyltransferase/[glutamine synthetase]-adenylyl-L-tyrosine phosphorylase [Corynebacterium lizhenjunii]|uniref:Bifunctional [glutamine synthetase] adenylyltransferase/[glutamine synthetase]-adenylyl-L-tyrosine phosphorylase n=1 Tax=Corynebacterium lizhenjunii TaxID=2709394 RepID=A0A7T0P9A2_9CORY|nr:bifunctional [glutamine synthetase] adenylyltransferase/[glutamine synthetase]-adenylyl-L-tyrosine phosphorylase [Corynebacterium lizhenjunii]QPK78553.1 bifunctional [glutamine synthetase] adenylyltransferase/[glutamine synthetase]-adenylyl-L-tyrosine phosphorylase [Corynebacterium lizhenjunii]